MPSSFSHEKPSPELFMPSYNVKGNAKLKAHIYGTRNRSEALPCDVVSPWTAERIRKRNIYPFLMVSLSDNKCLGRPAHPAESVQYCLFESCVCPPGTPQSITHSPFLKKICWQQTAAGKYVGLSCLVFCWVHSFPGKALLSATDFFFTSNITKHKDEKQNQWEQTRH